MSFLDRALSELLAPDEATRTRARRQIIERPNEAGGAVRNMLRDGNDLARVEAARILLEWADAEAVPELIDALQDPHPPVRQWAVQALGRTRNEQALGALRNLLQNVELTAIAAQALAEADDNASEDALHKALARLEGHNEPKDWLARFWVAIALSRLGSREGDVKSALQRVMERHYPPGQHTWPYLRVDALMALDKMGALDMSSLDSLLRDPSAVVRLAAARAALSGELQSAARKVLEEIAGGGFAPDLKREAAALLA